MEDNHGLDNAWNTSWVVWTEENIKLIIVEYEKHTGKTEHFSLREISAWRQRKINKWATLRKQTTRKAITLHERNKAALRKFNEKWKLAVRPFTHLLSSATNDALSTRPSPRGSRRANISCASFELLIASTTLLGTLPIDDRK